MDLLREPPPAYEEVGRLFDMARQLPASRRMDLVIGLVHQGALFARGTLDGYRQVNFLADNMRHLGWREHLLGGSDDMFDCDMLFSCPPEARADADPSFIRKPAVDLWPSHG